MEQVEKHRPFGVTLIAVLTIIGGIAFLASGIQQNSSSVSIGNSNIISWTISRNRCRFLALGIVYFVMAYGLLKGKGWAWTITLVLSYIGIALGFVSIATGHIGAIFGVIINAVIVYYIYRPKVKSFFGKTLQQYNDKVISNLFITRNR